MSLNRRKKRYIFWNPKPYSPDVRKEKAFSEGIYLIESIPPEYETDLIYTYLVMGSTGNAYKVKITNETSCSCPDYIFNRNRCKHIYFILIRD